VSAGTARRPAVADEVAIRQHYQQMLDSWELGAQAYADCFAPESRRRTARMADPRSYTGLGGKGMTPGEPVELIVPDNLWEPPCVQPRT
jgi:hypothetical protein